ncbi:MAG: molybdenum cofactor guanylyltransferase [Desulfitobacteriia bacterium]
MGKKIPCTGVLLVGGESRRMGKNKAFLEIEGQPLISRSLKILEETFAEVLISCRERELYSDFGFKTVTDVYKGRGPLGGLFSVLPEARFDYVFLVACDMPLLNKQAIYYLYEQCEDQDMVLVKDVGKIHALHAFYHRRILPLVEKKIKDGELRLLDLLEECSSKIVDLAVIQNPLFRQLMIESLKNVNTPEEWEKILAKTQKRLD